MNTVLEPIVDYAGLEDKVLVEMAHNGDSESLSFLINKYQHFVRSKVRPYFLIGADKEDLVQEGMIGLYKAIRDYREDKMASFYAFAELCISRQIITAIKTASRQKHGPLNSSISLDKPLTNEDSNYTLLDMIAGEKVTNPESLLINKEKVNEIERKIDELLSDLERRVLTLYMDGQSYMEISEELNTHVKSIDNALQRVKRKLERHFEISKVV
ncbi:RNA polymerase sporulation sigma factor SigH [Metabacillus litoralis]|uniref:RNA polymerase sporulation sigma factor SigH n=1 Tax=Metabacillus TaxID=2675233 RepID=UPI000EF5DE68|nr:RNA polymerase sporulation sigma factor SigH [Metabacillus litoralis]MCM3164191.1 RNA polymerase sporulation sigma factor SigH [Metabacillus litoralis]MCM3408404.1 RNA polymerase sporulation sigma factor SigH [Metabacillus litoralis]UHA59922.1 RNA polymerase sporulation sigma factor SigH [Metabacillus litoralis]